MKLFNQSLKAERYLKQIVAQFGLNVEQQHPLLYAGHDQTLGFKWQLAFQANKKLLSQTYKFQLTIDFPLPEHDELKDGLVAYWYPPKKEWRVKKGQNQQLANDLNQQAAFQESVQSVDIEKLELRKKGDTLQLTLIPIPGCYLFVMIPPMQYFVKLHPKEVAAMKKLAPLLHSTLKKQERKSVG